MNEKDTLEKMKQYFSDHPERYDGEVETLLEGIYFVYTERKMVEDRNVKEAYMSLHRCLCAEVGDKKADHYMDMVGTVCCEYERVLNNPASVSPLSGLRKPQIRF